MSEKELGFKMVKWAQTIEFVHDYAHPGAGQRGYNEDHEFYGNRMSFRASTIDDEKRAI